MNKKKEPFQKVQVNASFIENNMQLNSNEQWINVQLTTKSNKKITNCVILDPAHDKEWTCTLRNQQILSNLLLIASLRFFKGMP